MTKILIGILKKKYRIPEEFHSHMLSPSRKVEIFQTSALLILLFVSNHNQDAMDQIEIIDKNSLLLLLSLLMKLIITRSGNNISK
jgi:hypothetical protein